MDGKFSEWSNVGSEVHHRMVLRTLLFSLFINDVIKDTESEIRLFANRCVCYRTTKSEHTSKKLQEITEKLGRLGQKMRHKISTKEMYL